MESPSSSTEVLALVPARAGSKEVPGKNLRPLGGEPLIVHTLRAAASSERLTRIVVSTDSPHIADVSRQCRAEVPFLRPPEFATDTAPMVDVVRHALQWLRDHESYSPSIVVLLQPTVPFRTAGDIDRAVDALRDSNCDAVVTVSQVPTRYSPKWQFRMKDSLLETADGHVLAALITRRQDLETTYIRDGAIYAFYADAFWQTGSIYGRRTAGLRSNSPVVNIDTLEEWEHAERIIREKESRV